jgi:uncharacterized protein
MGNLLFVSSTYAEEGRKLIALLKSKVTYPNSNPTQTLTLTLTLTLKDPDVSLIKSMIRKLREESERDFGMFSDGSGRTCLMLALDRQQLIEVARFIILEMDNTDDLSVCDRNYRWNAMMFAASKDQVDMVELLLNRRADIDVVDINGMSPLMYSAFQGYTRMTELLISNGADVNRACISGGLTALMLATRGGTTKKVSWTDTFEVAQNLIRAGVDTEILSKSGKKAVDYCCDDKMREAFDAIVKSAWHDTPLHKATYENDLETMSTLLAVKTCSGVANVRGKAGWTALHTAVFCGRVEALKLLLGNGAHIVSDDFGVSPLHLACHKGNVEITLLLISG